LRLGRNMRNRAPKGPTGNLKASIKTKFSPDQLSAEVGPTHGKGSHAHLVEFGHKLIIKGKYRGHVPAKPFMTPAAEEERPKYLSDLRQAIRRAVK
jgi:HK97 gp10 family phage protein